MNKLTVKLLITASVLTFAAGAAQAQSDETKASESMEGATDLIKSAPAAVEDAAKATADAADDTLDAAGEAAGNAAEATGEAMEATGDALKSAGKDAADMAGDAAEKAERMAEDAAKAVDKAVAGEEGENDASADEKPSMASDDEPAMSDDKADMAEEGNMDGDENMSAASGAEAEVKLPEPMDASSDMSSTPPKVESEGASSEAPAMDDKSMEGGMAGGSGMSPSGEAEVKVPEPMDASRDMSSTPPAVVADEPATEDTPAMADDKSMEAGTMDAKGDYTIKTGDSLWNIARDRYGDGSRWEAIRDANPDIDPGNLKVGTTINLPAD
ncbi:LysM domain-containing protein [Pseudohoeflea suaedae]|uniref:LysM domain-containing protein n=1 Tax=Pseudohoeflea suaedae TaxID=877384 RepID=A0A4R5PJK5_9HYPH|nr:LysM domain-containing protein [Pseudohoeflea suaedae]TDH35857.1 LysM domain-containing protein [Pseudohoeflea suaedae]